MSITQVSRLLMISRPTLYRWLQQFDITGSTAPKPRVLPPQLAKIQDWKKFEEFVEHHGDQTQKELAPLWGKNVSHHTISRGLKKLGYTRKKTYAYEERCEEARAQFLNQLVNYEAKQLIYMDESGMNNNESSAYRWYKEGKRYHDTRPGKRRERLSIIGALCENQFLAPMVYQEYCTAKVIEVW